jgi:RND family efflux transporter MFP subunit
MDAMNIETAKWRRGALETEVLDDQTLARRRRRRNIILVAAAALIVLIAAFFMMRGGSDEKNAVNVSVEGGKGKGKGSAPSVTVVVPGRQQVSSIITATGSLAARHDMPVGIAGEGGMVARVLVDSGQWVRAGQTLAVIERSVQAQQAQATAAQIDVARADARLAQQELERAQALVSRGFISKADVDRRTASRDAANARVRVAQAQLGELRARMGRLDVRAPAAGLVLQRNVEPGQVVGAGSGPLFRIARGGEMELLAQLSQQDLARVRPGVPVSVTPVGSTQSVQGSVWQISPLVDPQTRLGQARVSVPYTTQLRPGGFAEARIASGGVDAPLLPQSAVQSDEKGNYVFLVGPNNTVVRRDIKVGGVDERGVTIVEGLSGQERVVLSAGAFLNPGQKIIPRRAAAQ